jgi:hypothetical protein
MGAGKAVRAGLAERGRISEWICNRRATRPPAPFQRNPPGRGRLAVFPRCSLLTYQSRYARRAARIARETRRVTMWAGLREALRAGRALPAAHFDRNATTPVTDLVR